MKAQADQFLRSFNVPRCKDAGCCQPKRGKEVKTMKYQKPQLTLLESALNAVRSICTKGHVVNDSSDECPTSGLGSTSAYEADE